MEQTSRYGAFLIEALGDSAHLPSDCLARRVIESPYDKEGDLIDIVTEAGARPDLLRRAMREHPRKTEHLLEYDLRLIDVLTEGEAFAWAYCEPSLEMPAFADARGAPDIQIVDSQCWVEAKSIWPSDDDRRAWELAEHQARGHQGGEPRIVTRTGLVFEPSPGLLRKFKSDYADARGKERQPSERLVVFFGVISLDLDTYEESAIQQIGEWARQAARDDDTRIVVSLRREWRNPVVDTSRLD